MEEAPQVEVRRSARRKRTVTAYRERDQIVVLMPQGMSVADERRYVTTLVQRVLAREARQAVPADGVGLLQRAKDLEQRYLAPQPGPRRELTNVSWVTNQSRRWGSCTPSAGTIRLSHRLQVMPDFVLDYVLLHELAHLTEPTHSARFWALVDRYPRAERAKGYLDGFLTGQGQPPADEDSDVDRA